MGKVSKSAVILIVVMILSTALSRCHAAPPPAAPAASQKEAPAQPKGDDAPSAEPQPKSAASRKAIAKYDQAVADADKIYKKAMLDATFKLNTELRKVQQQALASGDQEEALAIAARLKRSEDDRPPAQTPAPAPENNGPLQIVAAFYGQNVSWLDVTDKVRAAAGGRLRWSTTVQTKDWGDPAPGWGGPRTLLIRYTLNGKPFTKSAYESKDLLLP